MSIGVALATGVFKTYNDKVRAQAEAEREAAIKAEEREAGFELATFKAGLEEGNIRLRAKLDRELVLTLNTSGERHKGCANNTPRN